MELLGQQLLVLVYLGDLVKQLHGMVLYGLHAGGQEEILHIVLMELVGRPVLVFFLLILLQLHGMVVYGL